MTMYKPAAVLLAGLLIAGTGFAQPAPDYANDGPSYDNDASSAAVDPPTRVARLSLVNGAVSFSPAGEDNWVQAEINRPLISGDKLWTDRGARAELQIGSSAIRVDSQSNFHFLNLDDNMAQIELTPPERKRVLALMKEQTDRMRSLLDDLLTLAQLEGGPRPPVDHWIDVATLMQRVQADAQSLSAGRHELAFEGAAGALAGNEAELYGALLNLVSNAVRYTPAGGRITVAWQRRAQGAGVFEVRDTGIGIAREHLPRLGERFYRVDDGRSRSSGGTGLGLAIAKHTVQRHGGELSVDSEPGKGSTFRLLFPPSRVR